MASIPAGFRIALPAGWVLLAMAAWLYVWSRGIPAWAAVPAAAAFLVEYPFYLAAGFEEIRTRMAPRWLPLWLPASAVAPYLVYSLGAREFQWWALARLAALAVVISLWYVVLPKHAAADAGLLAVLGAALLTRYFDPIYSPAYPKLDVEVLGHLALIHVAAFALLVERGMPDARYGFWPGRREWKTGLLYYLCFLPVGFPLALALGVVRFAPSAAGWKIAATFFGILWVVALSEEFWFRGLLQPRLGIWVTSLLFGAVHLGFREFPNWRFALVAAVAGWFYGRAFAREQSIRASMVTHTLVVTTWRGLFQ